MDGYCLMPLPVRKAFWEARDEESWKVELDECLKKRELFGVSKKGKLMKVKQAFSGLKTTETGWEKWLAGMDGFGVIVMTAASLL
jgi:hypothetical protein